MRFSLTVTQYAVDGSSVDIIQDDVFEHGSTIKHGLQRKAETVILAEAHRPAFANAKWTNEDVNIDDETVRMMHKSVFTAAATMQLVLRQVSDDAEVTVESTVRNVNADKDYYIAEVQTIDNGAMTAEHVSTIQAANLRAAKLRLNGEVDEFDGQWGNMPFDAGIYKSHSENSSIFVLRPATAEESAELGDSQ